MKMDSSKAMEEWRESKRQEDRATTQAAEIATQRLEHARERAELRELRKAHTAEQADRQERRRRNREAMGGDNVGLDFREMRPGEEFQINVMVLSHIDCIVAAGLIDAWKAGYGAKYLPFPTFPDWIDHAESYKDGAIVRIQRAQCGQPALSNAEAASACNALGRRMRESLFRQMRESQATAASGQDCAYVERLPFDVYAGFEQDGLIHIKGRRMGRFVTKEEAGIQILMRDDHRDALTSIKGYHFGPLAEALRQPETKPPETKPPETEAQKELRYDLERARRPILNQRPAAEGNG